MRAIDSCTAVPRPRSESRPGSRPARAAPKQTQPTPPINGRRAWQGAAGYALRTLPRESITTSRRSPNKARHTLIHSRPSQSRLPPLAHFSIGPVAHFYFGADTACRIFLRHADQPGSRIFAWPVRFEAQKSGRRKQTACATSSGREWAVEHCPSPIPRSLLGSFKKVWRFPASWLLAGVAMASSSTTALRVQSSEWRRPLQVWCREQGGIASMALASGGAGGRLPLKDGWMHSHSGKVGKGPPALR